MGVPPMMAPMMAAWRAIRLLQKIYPNRFVFFGFFLFLFFSVVWVMALVDLVVSPFTRVICFPQRTLPLLWPARGGPLAP